MKNKPKFHRTILNIENSLEPLEKGKKKPKNQKKKFELEFGVVMHHQITFNP
jgi:hypothetical protein